jgi:hypothetical protein
LMTLVSYGSLCFYFGSSNCNFQPNLRHQRSSFVCLLTLNLEDKCLRVLILAYILLCKILHILTSFLGNVVYAFHSTFAFSIQCHMLIYNQQIDDILLYSVPNIFPYLSDNNNTRKIKEMRINSSIKAKLALNGVDVQQLDCFLYLRSVITKLLAWRKMPRDVLDKQVELLFSCSCLDK